MRKSAYNCDYISRVGATYDDCPIKLREVETPRGQCHPCLIPLTFELFPSPTAQIYHYGGPSQGTHSTSLLICTSPTADIPQDRQFLAVIGDEE